MPITKDLKRRWIERLEDPKSKHQACALIGPHNAMCCLGHLADMHGLLNHETGAIIVPEQELPDTARWFGSNGLCSVRIIDDFVDPESLFLFGLTKKEQIMLSKANDREGEFPIEMIKDLPEFD
ncbi:MAG: hypothetical protein AAF292_16300 [Pseudomonadota bacterium]